MTGAIVKTRFGERTPMNLENHTALLGYLPLRNIWGQVTKTTFSGKTTLFIPRSDDPGKAVYSMENMIPWQLSTGNVRRFVLDHLKDDNKEVIVDEFSYNEQLFPVEETKAILIDYLDKLISAARKQDVDNVESNGD